jgi:hypothetical protein
MTVFIIGKDRPFEISDAYFVALIFVSSYAATKLLMKVIERRKNKKERINLLFRGELLKLRLQIS